MTDTATPGAQLFPVDRLTENFGPDRPPIRTGRACDLTYAVWQVHDADRARLFRLFVMMDSGQVIDGQERRPYTGGFRVVPYHSLPNLDDVERRLLRLHLRHCTGQHKLPVYNRACTEVGERILDARARDAIQNNKEANTWVVDRDSDPVHV